MEPKFDEKTLQKVKQLAESPQGQQLLAMLRQAQPELVEQVSGSQDPKNAVQTLKNFLRSPEGKQLVKSLEGKL